jgi:hypothetical protein
MRYPVRPSGVVLLAALCAVTLGCEKSAENGENPADPLSPADAVGETSTYRWYLEGVTPGGESTVVRTGDGRITNETFVHWNNREYTLNSEIQLDENGYVIAQKLSGISPFGAAIDETFSYENGNATWRTPGEGGSSKTVEPAFYLPNESAAIGSLGALVRAASNNLDNEIALFPNGSASVEKVLDHDVVTPDGTQTVSLYAIRGIGFTPYYAWFDADLELTALAYSWLSMLPENWDQKVVKELIDIQMEQDALVMRRIASDNTRRIESPVVFENVNVVDVENGTILRAQNVVVRDGRIAEIGEQARAPDDALHIDGKGKYLSPGLWDMHGHFSLSDGVLNIAGGITSVRDIGSEHDQIMDLTAKFDSGEVIGPHTYRAGFMDRAGPFAAGWAAESLQDALDRVDFFAANGYIQIKLYSSIEPDWVAPIAQRAHSHGMRLSGHIPAFMSAEQAVRAGYDEIQHINMVFLNFLAGDREDTRKQLRFTLYGDEAGNLDLDSKEVQDFFALLKENDIVIDATAAIFETQLIHHSGAPDPTFAAIIDHLPPRVARPMYNPEMDMGDKVDEWARSAEKQAAMLKALHENGIQIVAGSDNLPAFTLHRELEVYAEAGIPPADVLRIATLDSARVLGVDDKTGSVAAGKVADLILLSENPLENVSAVREALLVMKGDTLYRPADLYKSVGIEPFVAAIDF